MEKSNSTQANMQNADGARGNTLREEKAPSQKKRNKRRLQDPTSGRTADIGDQPEATI